MRRLIALLLASDREFIPVVNVASMSQAITFTSNFFTCDIVPSFSLNGVTNLHSETILIGLFFM